MLDVYPPHEAAHTWKDFFIHIATIPSFDHSSPEADLTR
jgi:hypothetical protein